MDIKELFKGVAVVIDDNIDDNNNNKDKINDIILSLEKNNIPLLKYKTIPNDNEIKQFNNINFVLLDWELNPSVQITETAPVTGAKESIIIKSSYDDDCTDNIDFLKKLQKVAFIPVFIFSHLDPETITKKLKEKEELYSDNGENYIFVKKKDEIISKNNGNKIFTEIEKWLKQIPSIYVLKEWEKSLCDAKNKLFWDFYNINHKWPSVLQETFKDDGADINYELGTFIFKNI